LIDAEVVALGHLRRRADVLVEVDGATGAQDVQLRMMFAQPALDHFRRDREREHGVVVLDVDQRIDIEVFLQRMRQAMPVEVSPFFGQAGVQAELAAIVGERIRKHGKPCRVRAAFGHADQHGHHQLAQTFLQCRCLHQQTHDSTHISSPVSIRRTRGSCSLPSRRRERMYSTHSICA
jgi:hypothetical protein